jgi:hypothetical protein
MTGKNRTALARRNREWTVEFSREARRAVRCGAVETEVGVSRIRRQRRGWDGPTGFGVRCTGVQYLDVKRSP